MLECNISHRFRNENQFSACALFYCYSIPRRLSVLNEKKNHYLYLSPGHLTLNEVKSHLQKFDNNEDAMFCCFNSMDMASQDIIDYMENWMHNKIGLKK